MRAEELIRLAKSRQDAGLACLPEGLFIGGVPLLEPPGTDGGGAWRPRPVEDLNRDLSTLYGLPVDFTSKMASVRSVAQALQRGDIAHAQMVALDMRLPSAPDLAKSTSTAKKAGTLALRLLASGLLKYNDRHWEAGSPEGPGRFAPKGQGQSYGNSSGHDEQAGSSAQVTADQLRAIMPGAGLLAERYVGQLNEAMTAHGITTPAQKAAFLAQVSVETGNLQSLTERITEAAANRRHGYGDEESGDGYRYRGRGFIHLTGRKNYRALGYEDDPDALSRDPRVAAVTAAAYWRMRGLNSRTARVLNRREFDSVSRTVNGGDNGIDERWNAYQRALCAFQLRSGH